MAKTTAPKFEDRDTTVKEWYELHYSEEGGEWMVSRCWVNKEKWQCGDKVGIYQTIGKAHRVLADLGAVFKEARYEIR